MGESCRGPASSLEKGRKANKRKSEKQRNQRAIHSYLFHQKSKSEVVVGDSVPFVNQSGAVGFFFRYGNQILFTFMPRWCSEWRFLFIPSCLGKIGNNSIPIAAISDEIQAMTHVHQRHLWCRSSNNPWISITDVSVSLILFLVCVFFFIWFFEPNRTRSTSRRGRWTSAGVKKKKPSRCRRGAMTRRNGRRWLDTPLDFGSHSSCQNGPSQRSFLLLRHLFFSSLIFRPLLPRLVSRRNGTERARFEWSYCFGRKKKSV